MSVMKPRGFVHLILLLVIVFVVAATGFFVVSHNAQRKSAAASRGSGAQQVASPALVSEKPPVLHNLGITSFGPYDPGAHTSGSFVFSKEAARQSGTPDLLVFPFATQVCPPDGCKTLPEIEMYGLKLGTPIASAIDGTVNNIQDQGIDNEIFLRPTGGHGEYTVGYDHVANLRVAQGSKVKIGDVLGEAAPYGDGSWGRTEVYVVHTVKTASGKDDSTVLCPVDLLAGNEQTEIKGQLQQLFQNWNAFMGKDVYNVSAMPNVGCLAKQIKG